MTWIFTALTLLGWAAVVAIAARVRGRPYWIFAAIVLGIYALLSAAVWPHAEAVWPAFLYLHGIVFVHFGLLCWSRMRPWWYRALVSVPGMFAVAAAALALPWALLAALTGWSWLLAFPYALALFGAVESFITREELIDIGLGGERVEQGVVRWRSAPDRVERPLRVVQIADPHLGPFMSEAQLHAICARAVARAPDLILLTGDFLTMESHGATEPLTRALAPLRAMPGRCFACLGNHDLEEGALDTVLDACRAAGVRVLNDEATCVQTPAGPVQIVGLNYAFREREAKIRAALTAWPRRTGHLRLVLLHDPGAFRHIPDGEADLVLSGHTHGGQLGLLRLGLKSTIVSKVGKIPDHGLWAQGANRLYVHRGQGHYGFPIRVGVPREESMLQIHAEPR